MCAVAMVVVDGGDRRRGVALCEGERSGEPAHRVGAAVTVGVEQEVGDVAAVYGVLNHPAGRNKMLLSAANQLLGVDLGSVAHDVAAVWAVRACRFGRRASQPRPRRPRPT